MDRNGIAPIHDLGIEFMSKSTICGYQDEEKRKRAKGGGFFLLLFCSTCSSMSEDRFGKKNGGFGSVRKGRRGFDSSGLLDSHCNLPRTYVST